MADFVGEFDYNLKKLEIESANGDVVDISKLFDTISIYESVYENFMHGFINIIDGVGLLDFLPIKGEETISIKFNDENTDSDDFEHDFRVFAVKNLENATDQTGVRHYQIHFASRQMFDNMNIRLSRSYTETKSCEIVKNIATNFLNVENIEIEKCRHPKRIVIPNWNPFKAINYVCKNSISSSIDAADFFFFERKDAFYFKTLTSLKQESAKHSIKWKIPENDVRAKDVSQIKNLAFDKLWDYTDMIRDGAFGSRFYYHIPETKEMKYVDFEYSDGSMLNSKGLMGDRETSVFNEIIYHPKSPTEPERFYSFMEEWKQLRRSQISTLDNFHLNVSLPGDTSKDVGDVVDVEIPSTNVQDKEENDAALSGNYIITHVRHFLTTDQYQIQLKLKKDSYIREMG